MLGREQTGEDLGWRRVFKSKFPHYQTEGPINQASTSFPLTLDSLPTGTHTHLPSALGPPISEPRVGGIWDVTYPSSVILQMRDHGDMSRKSEAEPEPEPSIQNLNIPLIFLHSIPETPGAISIEESRLHEVNARRLGTQV